MRFSVVVTTWSDAREHLLQRNLAALAEQTAAPHETIVVVDHNPALQARLAAAWPAVDVIASGPVRGAAAARNAGTARATGDAVAFLDDDACPSPTWLERLAQAYEHDDVAGVGGTLHPGWPDGRPWWFPDEFDWVVGCTYRGLPARRAPVRNLIGANMSFRRDLLLGVGGERDGFGRVGLAPVACEETELCIRVRASRPRLQLLFEPGAEAVHHVTAERTRLRYFVHRCYAEGRGKARLRTLVGADEGLSVERAYVARTLPRGVLHGLRSALSTRDPRPLGRAAMIVAGLASAGAGYLAERAAAWGRA
ncbi:MAG TPA: glycosyltransferase [Gaiellaceae bacterium]|nr:glycosyltransferase [Gaiellaceae bacterium]